MIWLLILLSVVNVSMIGTLWNVNRRRRILPEKFAREVEGMLGAGDDAQAFQLVSGEASDYSLVMRSALEQAPAGHTAMLRAAAREAAGKAERIFPSATWDACASAGSCQT